MSSHPTISSGYFECSVNPVELKNCSICLEDITTNMVAHAAINADGSADQTKWHYLHTDCLKHWVSLRGNAETQTIRCPSCSEECKCGNLPEITFPNPVALDLERLRNDVAEMTALLRAAMQRSNNNAT